MNGSRALLFLSACLVLGSAARADEKLAAMPPLQAAAAAPQLQQRIQALVERVKKELVFLPGGTFEMGDWGSEEGLPYDMDGNARPLHEVTLDGFSMMAYKVTYEDFDLFTDATGQPRVAEDDFSRKYRAPRKPAGVNWYGAKAYCAWLQQFSGLSFDLPTEAQWEYAARSGGKMVLFATDNGSIDRGRNYPGRGGDRRTPDIGSYPPNPAGIYGMLDLNAREWVNDWYGPDYYSSSPRLNPKGPDAGQPADRQYPEYGPAKVVRGHSSPGNSPAFGGFVFSRGKDEPKEVRHLKRADLPGYTHWPYSQFRCVVAGPAPVRASVESSAP